MTLGLVRRWSQGFHSPRAGGGDAEAGKEQLETSMRREESQNLFGSRPCKAAGEETVKEIPANTSHLLRKDEGEGHLQESAW